MFLLPLMDRLPGCRCVLASDCVDNVQACKDSVEQNLMREASRRAAISSRSLRIRHRSTGEEPGTG